MNDLMKTICRGRPVGTQNNAAINTYPEKQLVVWRYAEPFTSNAASCRVLEKVGFQYEGTLRSNAVKNGTVVDMKMYSLLKKEL